jgi:protein-tyrosine phosphatase
MFDIHYHLIFGVDDGPKTIEKSIEIAEASIAEGVTHIVASPHSSERYRFDPDINRERLALLSDHFKGRLTLGLGCDFLLCYENIQDAHINPTKYTINNRQYLLVEFPSQMILPSSTERLYEFSLRGLTPIITHPERNGELSTNPNKMAPWLRSGCLVQVTAASLTGRFGKIARNASFDLLDRGWVHVIASDAHSLNGRPPAMGEAHRIVKKRYGQETADRLCIHNPRAIFFGEPLPPHPEPKGLYSEFKPRRSFFSRLFGG